MSDSVQIKEILKTSVGWTGHPLPGFNSGKTELKVLKYRISPGGKTSIHMHPLNGAGYMLSGKLTMYSTTDPHGNFHDPKFVKEITFSSGEAWAESVNVWHYGENREQKDAEFIVVFAGQIDVPPTLSLQTYQD